MAADTAHMSDYKYKLGNNRLGLWLFILSDSFLFGGLLEASRIDKAIINLAFSVAGRLRGGPGADLRSQGRPQIFARLEQDRDRSDPPRQRFRPRLGSGRHRAGSG